MPGERSGKEPPGMARRYRSVAHRYRWARPPLVVGADRWSARLRLHSQFATPAPL